jgi:hypothetical protein
VVKLRNPTEECIQWSLTTRNGVGWYIQNVASERYLGLPSDQQARNGVSVREVEHEFEWYLKPIGEGSNAFSYVTYRTSVFKPHD